MKNNTLDNFCNITTGKLDANQAVVGGEYPFYTCSEHPDTIDSFAFDDNVVLIAGNNAKGNFHINRFKGKFNAYQRTYVLTAKNKVCINYIYYILKLELKRLKEKSQGSQTKFLTMPILNSIALRDLDFNKQESISNVLNCLDEKIEINNKTNTELEAMAKLIYDYWFVQFDFPDENGKPYKSSGGKMVYNEELKREIPKGWTNTPLSKITPVSNSSVNPADYPNKNFRLFSIPVYDATNTFGIEAGETIGSNKFLVEEEDILVSKLNPKFTRVIFATDEEGLICSTEFVVWRTPNNGIKTFLYMLAISPHFKAHCTQSATGTSNSHKRVNPEVMVRFEIPFDKKVAGALGRKLEPMIKAILNNQRENTELAKLRDWLLPMLMNGQVTVD